MGGCTPAVGGKSHQALAGIETQKASASFRSEEEIFGVGKVTKPSRALKHGVADDHRDFARFITWEKSPSPRGH